jgi:hypothetical protein
MTLPTGAQGLGRDGVRILSDLVLRIRELQSPWQQLQSATTASGGRLLTSVFGTPSPARVVTSRVTHEMEQQLLFVMTQVKLGLQVLTRQEQWQQRWPALACPALSHSARAPACFSRVTDHARARSLATRSGSPRVGCPRLTASGCWPTWPALLPASSCGPGALPACVRIAAPSPDVLPRATELCPRWALLGWLLKLPCNNRAAALALRQAIVVDVLFFSARTNESFWHVESVLLLLMNSLGQYIEVCRTDARTPTCTYTRTHVGMILTHVTRQITISLLEHIATQVDSLTEPLQEQARTGLADSFRLLCTRQTVPSLQPLVMAVANKSPALLQRLRGIIPTVFVRSEGEAALPDSLKIERATSGSASSMPQAARPPPASATITPPSSPALSSTPSASAPAAAAAAAAAPANQSPTGVEQKRSLKKPQTKRFMKGADVDAVPTAATAPTAVKWVCCSNDALFRGSVADLERRPVSQQLRPAAAKASVPSSSTVPLPARPTGEQMTDAAGVAIPGVG